MMIRTVGQPVGLNFFAPGYCPEPAAGSANKHESARILPSIPHPPARCLYFHGCFGGLVLLLLLHVVERHNQAKVSTVATSLGRIWVATSSSVVTTRVLPPMFMRGST